MQGASVSLNISGSNLSGATAVLECERTLAQDAGDHVLFVGRVLKIADLAIAPLVFQGGHYHMLGEVL